MFFTKKRTATNRGDSETDLVDHHFSCDQSVISDDPENINTCLQPGNIKGIFCTVLLIGDDDLIGLVRFFILQTKEINPGWNIADRHAQLIFS